MSRFHCIFHFKKYHEFASIEDTVQAPSSQPPYNSHIIQAPSSKSLDEISLKKYHTFIEQYHTCFPTN